MVNLLVNFNQVQKRPDLRHRYCRNYRSRSYIASSEAPETVIDASSFAKLLQRDSNGALGMPFGMSVIFVVDDSYIHADLNRAELSTAVVATNGNSKCNKLQTVLVAIVESNAVVSKLGS